MAFLGGRQNLPISVYKIILGLVLLFSAYRLLAGRTEEDPAGEKLPNRILALISGAVIGLLSGLTGVGGGIFLSPYILLMGWARIKTTAATSVAFILVNSIAGLAGFLTKGFALPGGILPWACAALAGRWLGSTYGSRYGSEKTLRRVLAVVLVVAGLKLLLQ